jgi:hypothetical protein
VALSTGTSFQAPTLWLNNFGRQNAAGGYTSFDRYPRMLGDVNGDGKADIIIFAQSEGKVYVSLAL